MANKPSKNFDLIEAEQVCSKLGPDLYVRQRNGEKIIYGPDGIVSSGDWPSALSDASEQYPKATIVLGEDITVSGTANVLASTSLDGQFHTVKNEGTGPVLEWDSPSNNIGNAIANPSIIQRVKIDCSPANGDGIHIEDHVRPALENVQIHKPSTGLTLTEDSHWNEVLRLTNVDITKIRGRGIDIHSGNINFNVGIHNLTIGIDDNQTGTGIHIRPTGRLAHATITNYHFWPDHNNDPVGDTGIRIEGEVENLTLNKYQTHPAGAGAVALDVASGASGSMALREPQVHDYVSLPSDGILLEQTPVRILHPDIAVSDDFYGGALELTSHRPASQEWDDSLETPKPHHHRPSWSFARGSDNPEGLILDPADVTSLKMPMPSTDDPWSLEVTLQVKSIPSSGKWTLNFFDSYTTPRYRLVWYSGGGVSLDYNDGGGFTTVAAGSADFDTNEHSLRIDRASGGAYDLYFDGSRLDSGSASFLPSDPTELNISNDFDVNVLAKSFALNTYT